MATWDAFIAEVLAGEAEPEDMRVLRELLSQGGELNHVALKWEDRQQPPRYDVVLSHPYLDGYEGPHPHTVRHSDAFMRWSLETKTKLGNEQEEALRTLFLLQQQLLKLEEELGPSYFNSVLIEYLRIHGPPHTIALLSGFEQSPAPASARKTQALGSFDEVVTTIIKTLKGLGYTQQAVGSLLDKALEQYCDERFGLTKRRALLDP
ncbi:MAG TPA: hypothetical protein VF815_15840 [Myxococcaceae bacterium]|jgi:hypothetical protein